jgi:hypothetical protein
MLRNIKKLIIATLLLASFGTAPVVVTAQAVDQTQTTPTTSTIADNVCKGVLSAEGTEISTDTTINSCQEQGDDSFSFIVRRIINIFSIVVGAVSVVMIIIGGFRYIISGGDSSGVSSAKNTILYAVVGLVIVLFAQVIIRFILTNASPGN